MFGTKASASPIVVVKLGGSVLSSAKAFGRVARFLRNRLRAAKGSRHASSERFVAVVSAQNGATDALEISARRIVRTRLAAAGPSHRALDLLWSTGEIRSVALLTLHLEALGVPAAGLNVYETGLRLGSSGRSTGLEGVLFHGQSLRAALEGHTVVVVPGFFATDAQDSIVSLGRGGSDLTAVLLARSLGAVRCELVKDVPGYFSADPHQDTRAQQLPSITFSRALELADAGCDLVQRAAIEAAARAGLPLIIRSLDERAPTTLVSHHVARTPAVGKFEFPDLCCQPACPAPKQREPVLTGEESAFGTS